MIEAKKNEKKGRTERRDLYAFLLWLGPFSPPVRRRTCVFVPKIRARQISISPPLFSGVEIPLQPVMIWPRFVIQREVCLVVREKLRVSSSALRRGGIWGAEVQSILLSPYPPALLARLSFPSTTLLFFLQPSYAFMTVGGENIFRFSPTV